MDNESKMCMNRSSTISLTRPMWATLPKVKDLLQLRQELRYMVVPVNFYTSIPLRAMPVPMAPMTTPRVAINLAMRVSALPFTPFFA